MYPDWQRVQTIAFIELMKLVDWKYSLLFVVLTIVGMNRCRQKPPPTKNIIPLIQQTGQLVTTEYTLQKIVRAADNQTWYKIGDRRILLSVQAVVKAGVDLERVGKQDVALRDSVLQLVLPPPRIFSVSLPPDKVQVVYQDVSVLRSPFSAAEREALLRQAESQVRRLADSLGILETARQNATTFLRRLLVGNEFKDVIIEFRK